jgi:hypothetical protein
VVYEPIFKLHFLFVFDIIKLCGFVYKALVWFELVRFE